MIYLHKIWPNYKKHISNAPPIKKFNFKNPTWQMTDEVERSILHRHEIFNFNFTEIGHTVAGISPFWHFSNEMYKFTRWLHLIVKIQGSTRCLQCFDAVGWVAGRASGL